jgi:G6PDH family F420-dependent oxidoreductase
MHIGYGLSCEEYAPHDLLRQARLAEAAGFEGLWISDHFHPWNDAQGQSPFVWSMIGALSQVTSLSITTAVTCPTVRQHPAIVAQAAATSAVLTNGRFILGVGTGEALNEHILGGPWPPAAQRMDMLEEAITVLRKLWTGLLVNHHGKYYTVEQARLYTVPDRPVPGYMSGFGPRATDLAARISDGFVSVKPDAEAVTRFHAASAGAKPAIAGAKACYAATEDEARQIAHRLWANEGLPGELAQILPLPLIELYGNEILPTSRAT